ncbi:MAG: tRNA 4-thiouridine(8) synthase ThiI, partial [Clostridiales bacterium]|nr:tRNA 4-thiouridine(8) synthase ThiI [Clostridiales bacterium]
PYTSQLAEDKVMALLQKVAAYSGWIGTYVVPFTEIQEQIQKHCPEDLFTLVMRRYMMKLSDAIAKEHNCQALITGESLGQVASQTIQALACTDAASDLPVFRPCIGMDKNEIVAVARRIDTFDTSIQPYEDCCTIFTPRYPSTKPKLESVIRAEEMIDGPALMERALAGTRKLVIKP